MALEFNYNRDIESPSATQASASAAGLAVGSVNFIINVTKIC